VVLIEITTRAVSKVGHATVGTVTGAADKAAHAVGLKHNKGAEK
jgi:hypothetical protein